jgi:hypothetical protein
MFFFEKKNQKTFMPCGVGLTPQGHPASRGPHTRSLLIHILTRSGSRSAAGSGFALLQTAATPPVQSGAPLLSIDTPDAFCPHGFAIDVDLPCCASATGRFKSPGDTVCYEAALPWGGNAESESQWLAAL